MEINKQDREQKPEWPREVCIRQTLDAIALELGDDYDEDDDNGLVATAIIDSMSTIEINSRGEIPAGYELFDRGDQEDYNMYLESKQHLEKGVTFPVSQTSSTSGTIGSIDLKHGGYYDCIIDGEHGSDEFNFIQLAIDPKSKRRYILVDGSKKRLKDKDLVRELIKMTFQEIDSADFDVIQVLSFGTVYGHAFLTTMVHHRWNLMIGISMVLSMQI